MTVGLRLIAKGRVLLLCTMPLALVACQSLPDAATASAQSASCGTSSKLAACLLQSGDKAFTELVNDGDWITAAGEFSIALAESGKRESAREYLEVAREKLKKLSTPVAQVSAAAELGKAAVTAGQNDIALSLLAFGEGQTSKLDENSKKYDLFGKLASVRASTGDFDAALDRVRTFPETDETTSAYKVRSFREIAVAQAVAGEFDAAERTLVQMTSGFTYYQATARSDIAGLAFDAGDSERAMRLLQEAEKIARAQDNGYFVAGALRDIGAAYMIGSMPEKAAGFFEEAKTGGSTARTYQEKARALSRVATGMADHGLYSAAVMLFADAQKYVAQEKSEPMRHFSNYELSGSAAFAGDFPTAISLTSTLPETKFGSTSSLRAAAQRDVAWGLAKHKRYQDAHTAILSITQARERIMAISRVIRLLKNPDMPAYPRYL